MRKLFSGFRFGNWGMELKEKKKNTKPQVLSGGGWCCCGSEGEGEGGEKADGERTKVREKKYKIMICTATCIYALCTDIVAIVYKRIILHYIDFFY